MKLNPFRASAPSTPVARGNRHQRRDKTPYVVLSIGAVLFGGAVAFMMWPGESDGYIAQQNHAGRIDAQDDAQAITGKPTTQDGQSDTPADVAVAAPLVNSNKQLAHQPVTPVTDCAARRSALHKDSVRVDRFDPSAVAELNMQIAHFNRECAVASAENGDSATDAVNTNTDTDQSQLAVPPGGSPAPVVTATENKPGVVAANEAAQSSLPDNANQVTSVNTGSAGWNPTVLSVQSLLTKLGYQPGPADGFMGKRTRAAVEAFQRDKKMPVDGEVTITLLEQVLAAHPSGPSGASGSTARAGKPNAATGATATPSVKSRSVAGPAASTSTPSATVSTDARETADQTDKVMAIGVSPNGTIVRRVKGKAAPTSLAKMTAFEKQTVEWACADKRNLANSEAAYDSCIKKQLADLSGTIKPDLSKLSSFDRGAITKLCDGPRFVDGLAAYYRCLGTRQKNLAGIHRPPRVETLAPSVRQVVKSKCDGLQFTESLPVYYRCVDMQISQARR